jgi:hypothetical protein
MTHNLTDLQYAVVLVCYLLLIGFCVYVILGNVDAYTLNKAKPTVLSKPYHDVQKINLLINNSQILYMLNLHANTGSVIYQKGYNDAVDDILDYLGIKKKTKTYTIVNNFQYEKPQICVNYYYIGNKKYFDINTSIYPLYNKDYIFYYNSSRYEKFNNKTIILFWDNVFFDVKNQFNLTFKNETIITFNMR